MVTIQNDTLGAIVARAADPNLTVARLGELNALVRLQPGTVLDAGGAPYTTGAGDDLTTVAAKAHITVAVLAAANGAVPNIFPAQQPLLVRVSIWPVVKHDTFGMITAATGCVLADLAALNAGADVLTVGVAIAIPLHVRLGRDTSATRIVRDDDTLASLAGQTGLAVAGLARANQNLAGVLAPDATISCRGTTRQVAAVDTLGTIVEAFRAEGMALLTIAELATANATTPGLLLTGARILVPPRPVELPVQIPVHFPPDQAALPFTVELALRRTANVDPAFAAVPGVAATVTRLKPAVGPLDADGDGTLSLKDLAQRVWDVLRQRLATGSSSAGRAGAADSLMLVQVGDVNFSYSINPRPFYFAPPPLSAALWTPAPGSGGAAARITEGVDLDTWGRRFLADMDRLLSAAYAPGIVAIAPAEYVKLVTAKQQLADTIAETVREVVAHPAGLEPDLDAARDTLRQQLLGALSAAHTTDVIVQHRVSVHAPASAPDVAPRLSGTIVGATYRVPAHATLDGLAGMFGAPLDVFAGIIAGITGILHRGFTATHDGKTHTITADESLASVAAALTWDVPGLAAAYRGDAGLLQADADLGLALRTCTISADDTFDSVLLYLAPEVTGPATLAALVDRFVALNGATSGLLRPGAGLEVATSIVDPGDTLTSVAAALDVPRDDLAERNAATANILCAGATITVGERTSVVPDGATLAAVASALGCDVATLARAIAGRSDVLAIGGALLRPTPLRGTTKAEEESRRPRRAPRAPDAAAGGDAAARTGAACRRRGCAPAGAAAGLRGVERQDLPGTR